MPQNVKSKPQPPTLEPQQGLCVDTRDEGVDLHLLAEAIDHACDYRGDVTIITNDSDSQPLVGYIFDRRRATSIGDSVLRMMPADGSARCTIAYKDIARLEFSGRDTAAGRSFETWMRKYVQKKLAGEEASIHE